MKIVKKIVVWVAFGVVIFVLGFVCSGSEVDKATVCFQTLKEYKLESDALWNKYKNKIETCSGEVVE